MANRPTEAQANKIAELQAERYRLQGKIHAVRDEAPDDAAKQEAKAIERILEINDELTQMGGVTNEPESRKGENTHVSDQRVASPAPAGEPSGSTPAVRASK